MSPTWRSWRPATGCSARGKPPEGPRRRSRIQSENRSDADLREQLILARVHARRGARRGVLMAAQMKDAMHDVERQLRPGGAEQAGAKRRAAGFSPRGCAAPGGARQTARRLDTRTEADVLSCAPQRDVRAHEDLAFHAPPTPIRAQVKGQHVGRPGPAQVAPVQPRHRSCTHHGQREVRRAPALLPQHVPRDALQQRGCLPARPQRPGDGDAETPAVPMRINHGGRSSRQRVTHRVRV